MSFFDDGEETAARPSPRKPRSRPVIDRAAAGTPSTPRPRRPSGTGASGFDQHTLMVRRRIVAAAAVVIVIVVVLVISGCLKSQKQQSLKDYNHSVGELAAESDAQVSKPLFMALAGAGGKSALEVQEQINQLRVEAQKLAARAKGLNVPAEMVDAQRDLLLALDLRVEAITKIGALVPAALGGQGKQVSPKIAGDMEIFLASDVIYSQRVAPLIQQALLADGIDAATTATRFLPNVGWLEGSTVLSRLTGRPATGAQTGIAPGTHGSSLVGVAVSTNTLAPEPTLNHISGGGSPTFTVTVEDTGSNAETNVKVDVTVTAAGKQFKDSHVINSTQPGSKVNVEIPVNGVPVGVASKIEVAVEPVPGETNTENNKNTYLAIFGE